MPKKSINGDLYQELRKLFKAANPEKSKKTNELSCTHFWKENKDDREAILRKINGLKIKTKARGSSLMNAFNRLTHAEPISTNVLVRDQPMEENEPVPHSQVESVPSQDVFSQSSSNDSNRGQRETPAQKQIKEELESVQKELLALMTAKESGLILSDNQKTRLKALKISSVELPKKMKRLKTQQEASKKYREKSRRVLATVQKENPEISKTIGQLISGKVGRPRLEREQPGLLDAIVDIVSINSSADDRRRSETLRTAKTLNELLTELRFQGYNISRSGLYLRLLPRNCSTLEGKRHVKTVPVKLIRAQNTGRKRHQDTHFAAATIKFLKDLAVLYGPKNVSVISQDDKAKVPLGLPAAKKQAPILMRMDYRVQLPDHDFVIASGHKFIPSVYAGLEITETNVSYSGPTYIGIRSGRHDSSTAPRHAEDLQRILHLPEFYLTIRTENAPVPDSEPVPFSGPFKNEIKPILILFVDGGPDESPRYQKTLRYSAYNFVNLNLDAMFVATHAPGQSASNPVERRMAPLSKDLCGLILPHDSYGTHLSSSGKTINADLEKQNFEKAGVLLADIWSERVIDGFSVVAEYILPNKNDRIIHQARKPNDDESDVGIEEEGTDTSFKTVYSAPLVEDGNFNFLTEVWKQRHVRQSQYFLQIIKCEDINCCSPVRTNVREYLRDQFIPPPIPLIKSEGF